MDVDRIERLALRVERAEDFTMAFVFHGQPLEDYAEFCGTPACMEGHCVVMAFEEDGVELRSSEDVDIYLGLPRDLHAPLFAPDFPWADYTADAADEGSFIDRERAAATLRRLAETGRVEWHPDKHEDPT